MSSRNVVRRNPPRGALIVALVAGTAAWPPVDVGAERLEKIAVIKVQAPGLSEATATSLRNLLEVGVTRAVGKRLIVMTKDSAAAMVGGGEKFAACMEGAACDAEIGGALGVDYFVSGGVVRTARGLELGVTVLRVGRDVSVLKKDVKVFRAEEPMLDGAAAHCEAVVRAALGLLRPGSGRTQSEGAFGEAGKEFAFAGAEDVMVAFESVPDAATVLVDGEILCKETPCRKRVGVGEHHASFQKERYAASEQRFNAVKGAAVKATLAPRFGWVSVETVPPGVSVAFDGAEVGRAPVAWREVDEGLIEVAISDGCYLRSGERISVKAGERRSLKLTATPRVAGLKVNAEDEKGNAIEAQVKVDGDVVGTTGEVLRVPVCSRTISVPLGNEIHEAHPKLKEAEVTIVEARPASGGHAAGEQGRAGGRVPLRGGLRTSPGPMVRLPGGTYTMAERPSHGHAKFTVTPFLMDATEVTVAAYDSCVREGACHAPDTGEGCNWKKRNRAAHPVNCVDREQAEAYCAWIGRRLPTEAEWEWAARGAERGTTYPWGTTPPDGRVCWDGGPDGRLSTRQGTCAVGSHPSGDSAHGLKDLAGNVWEWTTGVRGPDAIRGGGWRDGAPAMALGRAYVGANRRLNDVGFRCAMDLEDAEPDGREKSNRAAAPDRQGGGAPVAEATSGSNPFTAGSVWKGSYRCSQGDTDLQLHVVEGDGSSVRAIFEFRHMFVHGRFWVSGSYDQRTHKIAFSPGQWIKRPQGYVTVGLEGSVTRPRGGRELFKGTITHPDCGRFSVTKQQ